MSFRRITWTATCTALLLSAFCTACGGGSDGTHDATTQGRTADLLEACRAHAAPQGPAPAPGSLAAIVDEAVAAEMTAKAIPAMTVTVAKRGVILYSRSYGFADLATCRPAQPDNLYQIGSVTKQFTAAAILQLQAAGQLDIDDKVVRYLPGYAFDPRLTLRMLLNQTSGLANYTQFDGVDAWTKGVAEAEVLTAIAKAPLRFAPGSAYDYSNSNYFVLASIVEVVGKTTYADYLSRHIFQPLGLRHTSYANPPGAQTALPYVTAQAAADLKDRAGILPDPSLFFGAGALWSTGEDLATWNAAVLKGAVVPAELLTLATTPPRSVPVFQHGGDTAYAMGWVRSVAVGHPLAWHNGGTYGYVAFNGVFLDDGFSLSILANASLHEDEPLHDLAQGLLQKVCGGAATAASC